MILLGGVPEVLALGNLGVRAADIAAAEGGAASPLFNDFTFPADNDEEFIWALKTPLLDSTSGGTTTVTDAGRYWHLTPDDGIWLQGYRLAVMRQAAAAVVQDGTITITAGSAGAGLALEIEFAFGLAGAPGAAGLAAELEQALALGAAPGAVGAAVELEQAFALGMALGFALEMEQALGLGAAPGAVGLAVELELVPGLGAAPATVGLAVEAEQALPLGAAPGAVGLALELEQALGLGLAVGLALELELALALGAAPGAVGPAAETEAALALGAAPGAVGLAAETEAALGIGGLLGVGLVVEVELALPLAAAGGVAPGLETEAALGLAAAGAVGTAVEFEISLGLVGGEVLPTLTGSIMRIIPAGRRAPIHLLPLDVGEVDDLNFQFAAKMPTGDSVATATVTVEARVGTDAAAAPLKQGLPQVRPGDVVQRVRGELGVPGVTYLIRCEATLASGKTLLGAAFMKVSRQA